MSFAKQIIKFVYNQDSPRKGLTKPSPKKSLVRKERKKMTKQELIKMVGNEDRAEAAMMILLKNVKFDFIRMCLKSELQDIENEIKEYEKQGYIYYANQHHHIDWTKPEERFKDREPGWGFYLTKEEQAEIDAGREKCRIANNLLLERNRISTILYHD